MFRHISTVFSVIKKLALKFSEFFFLVSYLRLLTVNIDLIKNALMGQLIDIFCFYSLFAYTYFHL